MKHAESTPTHEQVAEFRVGAILATEAIAVYIESDGVTGPNRQGGSFDDLPERLKIRVLAACEDEFRRRKQDFISLGMERRDWSLAGPDETQTHE